MSSPNRASISRTSLCRGLPGRLHLRGPESAFIHPDECIDCGACEPVCPVKAIFAEDEVPEPSTPFIELNKQFVVDHPGVKPCTTRD
jgi:NAD-dependent dihydropyrimidine dehydrogenase PreA subunit